MDDMSIMARRKRAQAYKDARRYRPLEPAPPELLWLREHGVNFTPQHHSYPLACTSSSAITLIDALGLGDDDDNTNHHLPLVRTSAKDAFTRCWGDGGTDLWQQLDTEVLFCTNSRALRHTASCYSWDWSVSEMLCDSFSAVHIDQHTKQAALHGAFFRLIRAMALTLGDKGEATASEMAHSVIDVFQWRLRPRRPASLADVCRRAMVKGSLRDVDRALSATRQLIDTLEQSQTELLAKLERDEHKKTTATYAPPPPPPAPLAQVGTADLAKLLSAGCHTQAHVDAMHDACLAAGATGESLWRWLADEGQRRERQAIREKRERDGRQLVKLRSSLHSLEREHDEREREARFVYERCPNAVEVAKLNAFRHQLWHANELVTAFGILQNFNCPLCGETMPLVRGEGVACASADCLAFGLMCYIGNIDSLLLVECAMRLDCKQPGALLVVDHKCSSAVQCLGAVRSYLCASCHGDPEVRAKLTCAHCLRGPFRAKVPGFAECHRCRRPTCDQCAAQPTTSHIDDWICRACIGDGLDNDDELPVLINNDHNHLLALQFDTEDDDSVSMHEAPVIPTTAFSRDLSSPHITHPWAHNDLDRAYAPFAVQY